MKPFRFQIPIRSDRSDGLTDARSAVLLEMRALEPVVQRLAEQGETVSLSRVTGSDAVMSGAVYLRTGNTAGAAAICRWSSSRPSEIRISVGALSRAQATLQIMLLVAGLAAGFGVIRLVHPGWAPVLSLAAAALLGVAIAIVMIEVAIRTGIGGSRASHAMVERVGAAIAGWVEAGAPRE